MNTMSFKTLAEQPHTKEVMDRLARELCMNFSGRARDFIDQAGVELGLASNEMQSFFKYWSERRATCGD